MRSNVPFFPRRAAALLAGGCLAAALLGGCAAQPADSAPAASSSGSAASVPASSAAADASSASSAAASAPAETAAVNITFTREIDEDFPQERGTVQATDAAGNTLWQYQTDWQAMTELERVQEIGQNGGQYYLNDGGTVVALDAQTGAVLWTNAEFGGASLHAAFRDNGDLLLCGYYGPDICWLDSAGNTLCYVETLDEAYFWPVAIAEEDGQICVTMAGTPDGEGEYTLRVDPQTLRSAP